MDTRTTEVDVEGKIAFIKANMPQVYKSIQDKAAQIGTSAYALVRRGLRGEVNCFYAFENRNVVGAPFTVPGIMADVAKHMVEFGCVHVCIWAEPVKDANGTH